MQKGDIEFQQCDIDVEAAARLQLAEGNPAER